MAGVGVTVMYCKNNGQKAGQEEVDRLTQANDRLKSKLKNAKTNQDGMGDEEEVVIDNMSKEELRKKYCEVNDIRLKLQKRLVQLVSPFDDDKGSPLVEKIKANFTTLKNQYFSDIFDSITEQISNQFENFYKEDDDDTFDAVVDREARRVLFDLLHITYHYVRAFKYEKFEEFVNFFVEKFELTSKDEIREPLRRVIRPYFKRYYCVFSRHRLMETGIRDKNEQGNMNIVINLILFHIKSQYRRYSFWNTKKILKLFELYIAKACELCWTMVLNTPQLYFFPLVFSLNDNEVSKEKYDKDVAFIYKQFNHMYTQGLQAYSEQKASEKEINTKLATIHEQEYSDKNKRFKKKKKNKDSEKNKSDDGEKNEEEEIDKIVKQHLSRSLFGIKLFDNKYHDCLNDLGDDENNDKNNNNIIGRNKMPIAYYGWPSLLRISQLESEKELQLTKTSAYCHNNPIDFMHKELSIKKKTDC